MKTLLVLLCAWSLVGCASIVNDSTHPVKIETKTSAGTVVTGAECAISNDYGTTSVKSGTTSPVRRSSKDMDITCVQQGQPDATGRAISRANAGMAGNIIFGGGIGAIIDHNKGTAYTYPTWVQLVFGQTLVFDRRDEKDGAPVEGKTTEMAAAQKQSGVTPTAATSGSTSTACSQGAGPCGR